MQEAGEFYKDDSLKMHAALMMPKVHKSLDDFIQRRIVCLCVSHRIACIDPHHQDFLTGVKLLVNGPPLRFTNMYKDVLSLSQFFLPFYGENDKEALAQYAEIYTQANPGYNKFHCE